MKLLLLSVLTFAILAQVLAQRQGYEEKCESGKTPDGRELDTCDYGKFLACKDTRCACKDPANQIYTYKNVRVNSRNKRSPKKGGGGGFKSKGGGIGRPLLAGAAGGLAGGYIGSKLAQGSNSGSSNNGGSGSSDNGGTRYTSGNAHSGNYQRTYQCYSRVEGTCILERYRAASGGFIVNQPGVSLSTAPASTTTTTTEAPSSGGVDANATSTTTTTPPPSPVAAAQVAPDILAIPECVENAECLTPEVKIVNGSVVGNVPSDPRLGVCVCQRGYAKDGRGLCTKVNTRSTSPATSIPALSTLLVCSLLARSFTL